MLPQKFLRRYIASHRYPSCAKVIPRNLKGKSTSSQEWLKRQLADPYVEKAKMQNYRCRSAFKLLEINEKFNIIKPGDVVIDCGAAPGAWSQVAVNATNALGSDTKQPQGFVFSTDISYFAEVKGAKSFGGLDIRLPTTRQKIKEALEGRKISCMLSDMAPNATGVRMIDQEGIMDLCYAVLRFGLTISSKGANLVMKYWDNGSVCQLEKDLQTFYEKVKRFKPAASRSDSSEHFFVARNFFGLEAVQKVKENSKQ